MLLTRFFEVKVQREATSFPSHQSPPLRHCPIPSPYAPMALSLGRVREASCLRPRPEGIPTPGKSQPWKAEGERTLSEDRFMGSYTWSRSVPSLILLGTPAGNQTTLRDPSPSTALSLPPPPAKGRVGAGYVHPPPPCQDSRVLNALGVPSSSDLVPEFSSHLPVHGWVRSSRVATQLATLDTRQPQAGSSRNRDPPARGAVGRGLSAVGAGPGRGWREVRDTCPATCHLPPTTPAQRSWSVCMWWWRRWR